MKKYTVIIALCSALLLCSCVNSDNRGGDIPSVQTSATEAIPANTTAVTDISETDATPAAPEFSPKDFCSLFDGLWFTEDESAFVDIAVNAGKPSVMFGFMNAGGFPYSEITDVEQLDDATYKIRISYLDETTGVPHSADYTVRINGKALDFTSEDGETISYYYTPETESLSQATEVFSFDEASEILSEVPEVDEYINMGMSMMCDGTTENIGGEECLCIDLGTNSPEKFTREKFYAVSPSGSVYSMDIITCEWSKIN